MVSISGRQHRAVGIWLLSCAVLVWALIVLGGITRLTRSGLSITQWSPIVGVLPPWTAIGWSEAFEEYRQTPEYHLVNHGMSLEAFRRIFLVEYAHRLFARGIGVVFALPLFYFACLRRVALGWRRMLAISTLGVAQGVVGWWMVASGLVDVPHVSPYRLAIHLVMALGLLVLLLWFGLDELRAKARLAPSSPGNASPPLRNALTVQRVLVGALLCSITGMLSGAVMAGMRAGYVSNTFPTMNGAWIPATLGALGWGPNDLLNDPVTVHFLHRLLATTAAGAALLAVPFVYGSGIPHARIATFSLAITVALQVTLGALTVLESVPVGWASVHQANAVMMFAIEIAILHSAHARSLSQLGRRRPPDNAASGQIECPKCTSGEL